MKLTTRVLGSVEWYYSAEPSEQAAIAAVRRIPGNASHDIEVFRSASQKEVSALKIEEPRMIVVAE